MKLFYGCIVFLLLVFKCQSETTVSISGSTENPEDFGQFDDRFPHCFRFTWLGPDFTKDTEVNSTFTCNDLLPDKKSKISIPCRPPLVITDNGTTPDMDYLFKYHRDRVLCRRSQGQACVKYSYSFNNQLQNITYMCAKVLSINEGAENNGCWSQEVNGYETKVCMCESTAGNFPPCNSATNLQTQSLFIILVFILTVFLYQ